MKPRTPVPPGLLALAGQQAGAVTRSQAVSAGLPVHVVRRRLATGGWRRISAGVYALAPDSWLQRAWAGVLMGGPEAVLGRAAAVAGPQGVADDS